MVRKMKKRYQKFMATSGEARAMVSALKPKAKILVKKLAKKFTKMQSKNTAEI